MRIASIVTALAAGIAAASAVAAPGQSQRKIGVGTKITNAGHGGIRNWQAGPPRSGILYMQDRSFKWSEVTMSGPCLESPARPAPVGHTTAHNSKSDRSPHVTSPHFAH